MTSPRLTDVVCRECNLKTVEKHKYCPDCGSEDPWIERDKYDFERDVELPVTFQETVNMNDWDVWRSFCDKVWDDRSIKGSNVQNLPPTGLPRMKYGPRVTITFQLTEELEIELVETEVDY